MNPEERSSSESERTRRDLELKVRTLTRGASVMGQKIKKKVKELKEELEGEDDEEVAASQITAPILRKNVNVTVTFPPQGAGSTNGMTPLERENEVLQQQVEQLQNVLANHVEEGKHLRIKVNELQKMVDKMMAENRALKTRMNEIATTSSGNEEGLLMSNSGKQEIKAGTIDKLIERLYNQDQLSVSEYVDTFLLTFRSFTTSQYVWETIMQKYDMYTGGSMIKQRQGNERWSTIIRVEQDVMTNQKMRLRIIVFLKRWLEHHFHDFDGELIQQFHQFITACPHDSEVVLLKKVLEVAEKKRRGDETQRVGFSEQPPESIIPSGAIAFDSLDPVEIARQLTLIESNLYKLIAPKELLSLSWQKKDKETKSPNLLKMIHRFNEVSNWVTVTLVKETDLKKRSNYLKKFLFTAEELLKLQNFNGVFEITSGLVSSPVSRLGRTWELITGKAQKLNDKFMELTSPGANFTNYRSLLAAAANGIPYVGLYLSDLTFIEEGNPDYLENGYVNFSKCRMVGEVIRSVQRFQQKPYNLKPVPTIQQYLLSHKVVSEKDCFEMSLIAEPREQRPNN